jgi:branched-chain amino acid transport system ATP-binding protein/urea transport system ATP-binding protein
MGELPSWSGKIDKDGTTLAARSTQDRAKAGLGYVPQGKQIFANLTVAENLKMGCIKDFANARETIAEIIELLPRLERLLDRQGGSLSGGEQQLLALGRCLCGKPSVILLDEPTEGIQPSICDEISDVLNLLKSRSDLSIVLVEQDIEFLWGLCDRVLAIDKGVFVHEIDPKAQHSDIEAQKFIGIED